MIKCLNCKYSDNPIDATYCIECGKPLVIANTGATTRLQETPLMVDQYKDVQWPYPYFIYRADIPALLAELSYPDVIKVVRAITYNQEVFYHGRKIVFMD